MTFQFWQHFSFGDISFLVWSGLVWSGLVWSGLVRSGPVRSGPVRSGPVWSGDLSIFKGQSNIAVSPALQMTTNKQQHEYSAFPGFCWTGCNWEIWRSATSAEYLKLTNIFTHRIYPLSSQDESSHIWDESSHPDI